MYSIWGAGDVYNVLAMMQLYRMSELRISLCIGSFCQVLSSGRLKCGATGTFIGRLWEKWSADRASCGTIAKVRKAVCTKVNDWNQLSPRRSNICTEDVFLLVAILVNGRFTFEGVGDDYFSDVAYCGSHLGIEVLCDHQSIVRIYFTCVASS